jgi:hypothetical protein
MIRLPVSTPSLLYLQPTAVIITDGQRSGKDGPLHGEQSSAPVLEQPSVAAAVSHTQSGTHYIGITLSNELTRGPPELVQHFRL